MSFDLNYWLKETIDIEDFGGLSIYQKVRPRIVCQDGYSVSIQASEFHYCDPRYTQFQSDDGWHAINGNFFASSNVPRNIKTDNYIPYETVELGFPSEPDELINEYVECEQDGYTNAVYPNTPVDVVEKLIEKHGGFKEVWQGEKENV